MKTTEDIVNDAKHFECNNLRNYDFKKDFMRFYNQKWYSEEEIKYKLYEMINHYKNLLETTNHDKWYERLEVLYEIEYEIFNYD